eukprot:3941490-Rhodomonas_salina.3
MSRLPTQPLPLLQSTMESVLGYSGTLPVYAATAVLNQLTFLSNAPANTRPRVCVCAVRETVLASGYERIALSWSLEDAWKRAKDMAAQAAQAAAAAAQAAANAANIA